MLRYIITHEIAINKEFAQAIEYLLDTYEKNKISAFITNK